MILLDTHIWVWWVSESASRAPTDRSLIESNVDAGLGVSVISCWEVAKKVERGKLELDRDVDQWIAVALMAPGVQLLPLSPEIAVESTLLPQPFHPDPADQMLVASSRVLEAPILSMDARILQYEHVAKAR